ncbi:MAG: hypothetical protein L0241_21080 [Planctomycetia bacterium]|nr:hypothetical protein [Planctomycetia bacterium]
MPFERNYPATVAEVLDSEMKFNRSALAAVRAFAASRPYRQSAARREQLIRELCQVLSAAYGIAVPRLVFLWSRGHSGSSCYRPHPFHQIELRGRFSVVTFLHEFAHARGADERGACRWSINLFAKCFPRSFARCHQVGHTLVREEN